MKVFLSSTSKDLKPYRKRVTEALERLGTQADRMEVWSALPEEPLQACLRKVEECDLFVGIYAHRYGYIPPNEEYSITELEYEHAKNLGKPQFCFLVDETMKWPAEHIEGEPGKSKLATFKARMQRELVVEWFTITLDLAFKVGTALGSYLWEHNVPVEHPPSHPSWSTEDFLRDYELQDKFRPLKWALSTPLQDQSETMPAGATLEALPALLDPTIPPSTWIQSWTTGWENILFSETDDQWLQQRLQMLLRGFRGLFNTCLADALIAVPPLDAAINPLQQSLKDDRRGAIFAPSGTGKSHKLLYLAAHWKKTCHQGEVFFCASPRQVTASEWDALENFLDQRTDESPPLLLLWDDLHHDAKPVHDRIAPLITKRFKTNTWWLGGYTRSSPDGRDIAEYQDIWLAKDVQGKLLKFADEWSSWKDYFQAWSQWAGQYTGTSFEDWEGINTPWEVAVTAGGLDQRIMDFFDQKFIEKAIYWILAALFLLNNEDAVPFPELLHVLHQAPSSFKKRLKRRLGEENQWEEELDDLFTDWERPKGDLTLLPPRPPPLRYDDPEKIEFPHQRLASKLWVEASEQERSLLDLLDCAYPGVKPGIEFLEQLDQPLDNIFLRFAINNKSLVRINLWNLDL
ncbi:MAG: DUF4062 domain-containing protein, partial [Promethearchaeota archaeon]